MADRPNIDYESAAEQLLAVLAYAAKGKGGRGKGAEGGLSIPSPLSPTPSSPRPVGAAVLARLVFGYEVAAHWTHETRRRRIRDTAVVARQQLARDQADRQICADGRGYWIKSDPAGIAHYAARRRRSGLRQLAAAAQVKAAAPIAAGQQPLFPVPVPPPAPVSSFIVPSSSLDSPIPRSQFRH